MAPMRKTPLDPEVCPGMLGAWETGIRRQGEARGWLGCSVLEQPPVPRACGGHFSLTLRPVISPCVMVNFMSPAQTFRAALF